MKQARLNEGVRSALLKDNTPLAATEAKPSTCNVVYKNNCLQQSDELLIKGSHFCLPLPVTMQYCCNVAGKIENYTKETHFLLTRCMTNTTRTYHFSSPRKLPGMEPK